MYAIGVDIGSTASKTVVLRGEAVVHHFVMPTGWNSKETAENISERLFALGADVHADSTRVVATGYGRYAVPFADKVYSEIKCHGVGGARLYGEAQATIIDVGGQDTKVVTLEHGVVTDFIMNDKCSAGTGKFIEVMATRLGVSLPELAELAQAGKPCTISSMCTVFAESEVIGLIGRGESRANIAAGILDSVCEKVASLAKKHGLCERCYLTGGLCETDEVIRILAEKLGRPVTSDSMGRYAGALGAAICAAQLRV